MMELFIETLTGTAFELRVSPFETIMSVKAKIQRLEGIPISQQHLIWQSMELEDDYCLHDYSIHDGATLKLVLAMRGGPINTRRIAMEDPALREMAEYMEANREEILDKLPGNRQVTLLVYREGDQLNFFRVVDRGDGTLTPLSESLSPLHFSGASMYNLYDDEEEEEPTTRETVEENVKTKEKMELLRSKMENLTLTKKPKKKIVPRPPSSGRPSSRTRSSAHRLGSSAGHAPRQHQNHLASLTKTPLPPLGQTHVRSASGTANPEPPSGRSSVTSALSMTNNGAETPVAIGAASVEPPSSTTPSSARGRLARDMLESAKLKRPLSSVKEDYTGITARSLRAKAEAELRSKAAAAGGIKESEDSVAEGGAAQAIAAVDKDSAESGDAISAAAAASSSSKDTLVIGAASASESQQLVLKNNPPLPPTSATASSTAQKKGGLVELSSSAAATAGTTASNALQSEWTPSWSAAAHSYSSRKKDVLSHSLSMRPPTSSSKGLERLIDHNHHHHGGYESSLGRPTTTSATSASSSKRGGKEHLSALESLVRPPTSKYSMERKQGLMLESLSQSEARGLLRQASIERLGSSKLANFVRSASKSRAGYNLGSASLRDGSRGSTPEGRLVSGRLQQRVSAGRDRDRLSPTPRLPPVKQKKKASKRCFVCAKKTGLATSYQCRCGNNFCATHRYAESHDCTFDYKTEGRKLLEQANPVVQAPKLPKI